MGYRRASAWSGWSCPWPCRSSSPVSGSPRCRSSGWSWSPRSSARGGLGQLMLRGLQPPVPDDDLHRASFVCWRCADARARGLDLGLIILLRLATRWSRARGRSLMDGIVGAAVLADRSRPLAGPERDPDPLRRARPSCRPWRSSWPCIALPIALYTGHTGRGGWLAVNVAGLGRAMPVPARSCSSSSRVFDFGLLTPLPPSCLVSRVPPILANTHVGMRGVDRETVDAARGMGMREREILTRVEIPSALPVMTAGVADRRRRRGGHGHPRCAHRRGRVRTLHRRRVRPPEDQAMLVSGAILVAVLAVVTERSFTLLERRVVSPGSGSPRRRSRPRSRHGCRADGGSSAVVSPARWRPRAVRGAAAIVPGRPRPRARCDRTRNQGGPMRTIRMAALGATTLALLFSACSSGGSSPSPSAAASVPAPPSAAASASAAPAPSSTGTIASQLVLGGPPECPSEPVLRGRPEEHLRHRRSSRSCRSTPEAHSPSRAVETNLVDVGLLFTSEPVDPGQGLRPAGRRQGAPEGGQPRPGRPQGPGREGPRAGRPAEPVHGQAHPGAAVGPTSTSRSPSTARTRSPWPALAGRQRPDPGGGLRAAGSP